MKTRTDIFLHQGNSLFFVDGVLARPDELQQQVAALYKQAETAPDRQDARQRGLRSQRAAATGMVGTAPVTAVSMATVPP